MRRADAGPGAGDQVAAHQRVSTILPKTSPSAIAASASRARSIGQRPVDHRPDAGRVQHRHQRRQLLAGAHGRADHLELQEEDPGQPGVVELRARRSCHWSRESRRVAGTGSSAARSPARPSP